MSFKRRLAAWILTGLLTAVFVMSGVMKLLQTEDVVKGFTELGMKDKILLIATGELASAILFLLPRTHSLGVLLLSSYMGGAILVHMTKGESYVGPSVILLLVWLTAWLRNPLVLSSFYRSPPATPV
ncbi:MAG: DoxX family protein [Pirellulales bacterium]